MEKETDNTIKGVHIKGTKDGVLLLNTNKTYCWHIPIKLRVKPIQLGDIVMVATNKGKRPVLVVDVFRENIEETNKLYKQVVRVIEKAPSE